MANGRGAEGVWPTPQELERLVVPDPWEGPGTGKVFLGSLASTDSRSEVGAFFGLRSASGAAALAAEFCRGVLVIGATRSGKTRSILAPAVTWWDGPVITTSIRDDVLAETIGDREQAGWPILIYNPKGEGGYGSDTWSPLTACMGDKPWANARRTAKVLVQASGLADGGANRDQNFWNATAETYLAPLLLAAAQLGPSMEPVMRWLHTVELAEEDDKGDLTEYRAKQEIRGLLKGRYDAALQVAEGVWNLTADETRDGIYVTTRTALAAYEDEDVLETCGSGGPGDEVRITPDSVLGTPKASGATLYLISPPTDRGYFAPLFSALLSQMLDAAFSRTSGDAVLDPPLLLALDEVANITPIKDLPDYASMSAGAGIQLITVLQDLGQAESIWGEAGTRTLLTNHPAKLILGGTSDTKTLKWVQDLFGEVDMVQISETQATGGNRSVSRSLERRPMLNIDEIRRVPKGGALLIYGSERAAIVTLAEGTTVSLPS